LLGLNLYIILKLDRHCNF